MTRFNWDDPLLLEHQLTDEQRAAAGAGIALLLADRLSAEQRRALGIQCQA